VNAQGEQEQSGNSPTFPPVARDRNLVWGFCGFGISIPAFIAINIGFQFAVDAIQSQGAFAGLPLPPARGEHFLPRDITPVVLLVTLVGAPTLAGVLTARRVTWWAGTIAGAVIDIVVGGAALLSDVSFEGAGLAIALQLIWLTCGVTGGLLSAFRRRGRNIRGSE
jgi:hypothetical protein